MFNVLGNQAKQLMYDSFTLFFFHSFNVSAHKIRESDWVNKLLTFQYDHRIYYFYYYYLHYTRVYHCITYVLYSLYIMRYMHRHTLQLDCAFVLIKTTTLIIIIAFRFPLMKNNNGIYRTYCVCCVICNYRDCAVTSL